MKYLLLLVLLCGCKTAETFTVKVEYKDIKVEYVQKHDY